MGGASVWTFSFTNFSPSATGTYYRKFEVQTIVNGSWVKTDSWSWGIAITISAPATGNLNVTVRNQNGSTVPGAVVQRYTDSWGYIDQKTTNSSGVASWNNISADCYNLEAYANGEYWVNDTNICVSSGSTTYTTLQRNEPYAYDIIVNPSNFVVMVTNDSPVSRSVRVTFYVDDDTFLPYDCGYMHSAQTVPAFDVRGFTFFCTPPGGTYYVLMDEVETYVNGAWTRTDSWGWYAP